MVELVHDGLMGEGCKEERRKEVWLRIDRQLGSRWMVKQAGG